MPVSESRPLFLFFFFSCWYWTEIHLIQAKGVSCNCRDNLNLLFKKPRYKNVLLEKRRLINGINRETFYTLYIIFPNLYCYSIPMLYCVHILPYRLPSNRMHYSLKRKMENVEIWSLATRTVKILQICRKPFPDESGYALGTFN